MVNENARIEHSTPQLDYCMISDKEKPLVEDVSASHTEYTVTVSHLERIAVALEKLAASIEDIRKFGFRR